MDIENDELWDKYQILHKKSRFSPISALEELHQFSNEQLTPKMSVNVQLDIGYCTTTNGEATK